MVEKVVITDNACAPMSYLPKLKAFKNGTEFNFNPGVNVIVGKNGSGKSTLLNLIKMYLLVDDVECSTEVYNCNISRLTGLKDKIPDGVGVYADYVKNTFRLCHDGEMSNDGILDNIESFSTFYTQKESSTGESVLVAINSLFKKMFSTNTSLSFDYEGVGSKIPSYAKYVSEHRVTKHDEFTILMDEPDRNLDIQNITQIHSILNFHKEHTQIIAVVHNPLLISSLSKNPEINFIEVTPGYVNKIKSLIKKYV